jgi:hypothetical protein
MCAGEVSGLRSEVQKLWTTEDDWAVWFESDLRTRVSVPIKHLRSWAFVFWVLCIWLSTLCADLLTFGLKPCGAFTIAAIVNVPLGYFLSTVVFSGFWSNITPLM